MSDLTKLSDEDLLKLKQGDYAGMSTEGLQAVAAWRQAQKPSTGMDMLKAAGSAPGFAVSQTMAAPEKLGVFGLSLLPFESTKKAASKWGRDLQEREQATMEGLYGTYAPETGPGRFTKSTVAGLIPIPGMGMAATKASMATGAAGGALAQGASELELGPVAEALASMGPGALAAAKSGLTPGFAQKRMRDAWEAMSPRDRAIMLERLQAARGSGADIGLWQAAPEGSSLRRLGEGASAHPEAKKIQELLRNQTWQADQSWVADKMDWKLDPLKRTPLDVGTAQKLRDAIAKVVSDRQLHPDVGETKLVDRAARRMGSDVTQTMTQAQWMTQLADEYSKAAKQFGPLSPQAKAASNALAMANIGKNPPPTTTSFVPRAKTIGEAESALQEMSNPGGAFATPAAGTKIAVNVAAGEVLKKKHPKWQAALDEYASIKDLAELMAKDQSLKGRQMDVNMGADARVSALPEAQYAFATSPMWAMVPPIRRAIERSGARTYDKALGQKDLAVFQKIAAENPQLLSLLVAMQTAAKPVQHGSLGEP